MTMGENTHVDERLLGLLDVVLQETATVLATHLPIVREITVEFLDSVFAPKALAKQLVLAIALDAGIVSTSQILKLVNLLLSNFSSKSRMIRKLEKKQSIALNQDEWMELAERIDNIQGNDVWRSDPQCPLYEQERITLRVQELHDLIRRQDMFGLMFDLRGGICRNKFGLLHEGLFCRALSGSKVLIETYHNVVCAALDFICDAPNQTIPTPTRLAFFNETRHAYGRTALILSGGAGLGFYHGGVAKALMDNNLMPRVIAGTSAGSILCAMIGTRTDGECIADLYNVKGTVAPGHSGSLMCNFFQPPHDRRQSGNSMQSVESSEDSNNSRSRWKMRLQNAVLEIQFILTDLLTGRRRAQDILLHDTEHLRECCRVNIGNFTFREAFERTGRIINILVTPLNSSDPPRLLNYLTAPHILVWSAAVASSSLPGVFEANRLLVKEVDGTVRFESSASGMSFSDGSMEQDLPRQQLSEMFNVNHFIISQANPHAVMFASYNQKSRFGTHPMLVWLKSMLIFVKGQLRGWLTHFVDLVGARRIAPLFATQRDFGTLILTQEYEGRDCDISLVPWHSHRGIMSAFMHCIYNPSEDEFIEWISEAERETWKYLPAIKSHIAEEITLDRCVQRLRQKLAVERNLQKTDPDCNQSLLSNGPSSNQTSLHNVTKPSTTENGLRIMKSSQHNVNSDELEVRIKPTLSLSRNCSLSSLEERGSRIGLQDHHYRKP